MLDELAWNLLRGYDANIILRKSDGTLAMQQWWENLTQKRKQQLRSSLTNFTRALPAKHHHSLPADAHFPFSWTFDPII
jgi:hypothetical protein